MIRFPEKTHWDSILQRPMLKTSEVDRWVEPIVQDIRLRGDKALLEYTKKFDKADMQTPEVSREEIEQSVQYVNEDLKQAMAVALANIETFHRHQQIKTEQVITMPGVTCWQKPVAIEKVGLYVPGGSAPLFSSVLMLAVPARIAGCSEIVLCSPPNHEGKIHPAILYAARLTGVTKVFAAGGAQAIAAMAYGTATIPRVYKIFGPGNQYVTAAKQLVSRSEVAIDMPAGPSELVVLADESANPAFTASDLLSQAEHGPDSQVLLITTSEAIADQTLREVERQLPALPRAHTADLSLSHSKIVLVQDIQEAIDMTNAYAPEHLIIASGRAEEIADQIINAGSVFLGHYTPESAGDYASGTNHTLPTNGYARVYHGVNLDDFVKKITFQQITREGLQNLGPVIMTMAENEDLVAHSRAVKIRISNN